MASCGESALKTIDDNVFANVQEDLQTIEDAANSEDLTVSARVAGTVRSLQGRLHELSGYVALNNAVWTDGIDFTGYDQYMIYNGAAYKPIDGITLPYTSTATPDTDFVEPFTVYIGETELFNGADEYNKQYLGNYTDYVFASTTDMIAGTTIGGETVTFSVGMALTVVDEDNEVKSYVVTNVAQSIQLDTTLYAKRIYATVSTEDSSTVNPIASLDTTYDARNTPVPGLTIKTVSNADTSLEWTGGVLSRTNDIYFLPNEGTTVLKYNIAFDTFTEIGTVTASRGYTSGVLAANGHIYAASKNAEYLLDIDTSDDTVAELSGMSSSIYGYDGGVNGANGYVYFVPASSTQVLRYDYVNNTYEYIGSTYGTDADKWSGGCIAGNGNIYCAPFDNQYILKIDSSTQSTSLISCSSTSTFGRWKGAVLGQDGLVYFMPYNDDNIMVLDPDSDSLSYIADVNSGNNKFVGGIAAKNGKIYAIPYSSNSVTEIDVEESTATEYVFDTMTSANKFYGAVMSTEGVIYCCPSNNETSMLVIDSVDGDNDWMLSAYCNKF